VGTAASTKNVKILYETVRNSGASPHPGLPSPPLPVRTVQAREKVLSFRPYTRARGLVRILSCFGVPLPWILRIGREERRGVTRGVRARAGSTPTKASARANASVRSGTHRRADRQYKKSRPRTHEAMQSSLALDGRAQIPRPRGPCRGRKKREGCCVARAPV
jgi:hypothetical protein